MAQAQHRPEKKAASELGNRGMLKEFKDFIAKGNVMDMAVGIILGAAFTAIVTSMVDDLINPLIGIFVGGVDFGAVQRALSQDRDRVVEREQEAGAEPVRRAHQVAQIARFVAALDADAEKPAHALRP